jgi:Leucine-rich repeat (LRR) protein
MSDHELLQQMISRIGKEPHAIEFDEETEVLTELDLSELALDVLPDEVCRFIALQALSLDNNQLQALPPEIAHLANLRELSLDGNQLRELPPEIAHLTNRSVHCAK